MSISAFYRQISPADLERILDEPGSNLFDEVWKESELRGMELIKACEALFFLLTGHDKTDGSPFAMAIFGRTYWKTGEGYFDKDDGIYYGSCYLTPLDVHEIANTLSQVSEDDILQRLIQNDFEATWGQPEDIIMPYFRDLTSFYVDASKQGNAVLAIIS